MKTAKRPWRVLAVGLAVATVLMVVTSLTLRAVGGHRYRKARATIETRWGSLDPASFVRPRSAGEVNAAAVLGDIAPIELPVPAPPSDGSEPMSGG